MPSVWFVTGSSRGLGRVIVETALASGASVVATARSPETLDSLAEKFGPDRFLALRLDVTKESEVTNAVNAAREKFGRIDVVVNNAGRTSIAALEDMETRQFQQLIDTNFMGAVYVTKAVTPLLRRQGSGHIFQVSSLGDRMGMPGLSAYQSAKWALTGFSMAVAQELAPLGITVTILEPGTVRTGWAGQELKMPEISDPYKPTVGATAEMFRQMANHEECPPERIAQIIVDLSKSKDVPLRLVLGPQAVEFAKQSAEALAESDEKWRHISLSCI
ncbi:hypothetical protein NEMBOFW57_001161 [Staphylotrichum longicolle]|uniref:Ketoreductase domain-containing protein n=1 Tax=Staphylotrichum longicolle TaxID=669026 RepID=A0AAD4F120_9PEZI|nr:hypothetical protein NEMBOFW57_001161 [Staphylotrichum longicolle]